MTVWEWSFWAEATSPGAVLGIQKGSFLVVTTDKLNVHQHLQDRTVSVSEGWERFTGGWIVPYICDFCTWSQIFLCKRETCVLPMITSLGLSSFSMESLSTLLCSFNMPWKFQECECHEKQIKIELLRIYQELFFTSKVDIAIVTCGVYVHESAVKYWDPAWPV